MNISIPMLLLLLATYGALIQKCIDLTQIVFEFKFFYVKYTLLATGPLSVTSTICPDGDGQVVYFITLPVYGSFASKSFM